MNEGARAARDATQAYDEALTGATLESTVATVAAAREAGCMPMWERLEALFLRPVFISEAGYAEVVRAALSVGRAMSIAARRAMADPGFRGALKLPDEYEYAISLDVAQRPELIVGRLDGFVADDESVRFIEYNAFPAGIYEGDHFGELYDPLAAMDRLRKRFAVRRLSPLRLHDEAIRIAMSRLGVRRPPVVGVIELAEKSAAGARTEGLLAFAGAAAARGIQVVVAPADGFEYRRPTLYVQGVPVDFVVPSDFDEMMRMISTRHPALAAFAEGAASFVGGFASSFLALAKALYATLSDPLYQGMFDAETIAELNRVVPWTRLVSDRRTIRDGKEIDLLDHIADHREGLVLKPCDGWGGKGVILGWHATDEIWRATLERAKTHPHIVQERVRIPRATSPYWDGERIAHAEHRWDFCPFVWNESWAGGALCRASSTEILNMGAGAGVDFPWFAVRPL